MSDELLVVLVGNMVTEEALPNYAVSLDQIAKDPTGTTTPRGRGGCGDGRPRRTGTATSSTPISGSRGGWTCGLSRRTIHHLIRNGFDSGRQGDDCAGMIYAAFQERATRITHGNVGKLAAGQGDDNLAGICRKIAGDEARHEAFYTRVVGQMMERDPDGAVLAFRAMLKGNIAMPGRLMFDGADPDLFDHFAVVSQRLGVYTIQTYAKIIGHLVEAWGVAHRSLSGKAAKAQDYLCQQPGRYEFFADEIAEKLAKQPHALRMDPRRPV